MIIEKEQRPIESLMDNAFVKMRGLINADTVMGTPVVTSSGVTIIPISKVVMGFATGGGEYADQPVSVDIPYAGGSGAGASVSPVAFLVNDGTEIKLISVDEKSVAEKILETIPDIVESVFSSIK